MLFARRIGAVLLVSLLATVDGTTITPDDLPVGFPDRAINTDAPTKSPVPTDQPTGAPTFDLPEGFRLRVVNRDAPTDTPVPTEEPTYATTDAPTWTITYEPTDKPTYPYPPTTNPPVAEPTTEAPTDAPIHLRKKGSTTMMPATKVLEHAGYHRALCNQYEKIHYKYHSRPDGKPVVLHTHHQPKLTYHFTGNNETIHTYQQAQDFCSARGGRVLASPEEWCRDWHDHPVESNIYGGLQDNEEWVPIRTARGHDVNEWLQVGHLYYGSDALKTSACRTYKELYKINETDDTEVVISEEKSEVCQKPVGCTGNTCVFGCNQTKEGYYPDPKDCRSYCYCSGHTGKPSFWQQVEGDGLVWDPFCGSSDPLDARDVPLGGMTGGCPNHDWAIEDHEYCTANPMDEPPNNGGIPKVTRSQINEGHRSLEVIRPSDLKPRWGLHPHYKYAGAANTILCTLLPRAPASPKTCAYIWGDPHVRTFDKLNYECQGTGDYVLAKSLDSAFQLQGRLQHNNVQGTVATAAVLKTGHDCEPSVEVRFPKGQCKLEYFIDGVKMDLDYNWVRNGTLATGMEAVHFFVKRNDRHFYFPQSEITLQVRKKHSDDMGCYLTVQICLPDHMVKKHKDGERIIGLFGTPNGDPKDDFMNSRGVPVEAPGNLHFKPAYQYCTHHWCIRDDDESLFETPMSGAGGHCDEPYDHTLETMVMAAPPELYAICEGNIPCLIDGVKGNLSDAIENLLEFNFLEQSVLDPPEQTVYDPDSLTQDKIFELAKATVATPAQPAYTKGDPHFNTFGGERFDFHGACDLVLLHNPTFHHGTGMDIHIRTKIQTWWSYVESSAVRIGREFLEVVGGSDRSEWLWINRKVNQPLVDGQWHTTQISGYRVRYRQKGPKRQVHIYLGDLDTITLQTYKDFVRVDMDFKDPKHYAGAMGLMGRYPDGARLSRDRMTLIQDPNEFGQEWQVHPKEPKLFHNYEGAVKAPQRCTMPDASTTALRRRRLRESSVSQEDADNACGRLEDAKDRKACVADILATEDLRMADAF